eukprot:scaffold230661_cov15-Tisochrysis_lutea.AAC.1
MSDGRLKGEIGTSLAHTAAVKLSFHLHSFLLHDFLSKKGPDWVRNGCLFIAPQACGPECLP